MGEPRTNRQKLGITKSILEVGSPTQGIVEGVIYQEAYKDLSILLRENITFEARLKQVGCQLKEIKKRDVLFDQTSGEDERFYLDQSV